jgi:hypothetical protein
LTTSTVPLVEYVNGERRIIGEATVEARFENGDADFIVDAHFTEPSRVGELIPSAQLSVHYSHEYSYRDEPIAREATLILPTQPAGVRGRDLWLHL